MRALSAMSGALGDLRAAALDDLGGEENVSALRAEVLEIGLRAEWVALALLNEISSKMSQSRAEGHSPCPSRYRATQCAATYLDLAARRFREVGLDRRARDVGTLAGYLAKRDADAGERANGDGSEPVLEGDGDRPAPADVGGEP